VQLSNEFVVPRGVEETWKVLTDVERIAPAMPGAQLTGVEDGKYTGTVKVKVGPVTASYRGVASFRELDEANHHAVLDAKGKESTGRGQAAAVVSADLLPEGDQTRVRVTTDLTISGPLAQFGRGAIAEVSTRLLGQFVDNLKNTLLDSTPPAAEATSAAAGTPAGTATQPMATVATAPRDSGLSGGASAPADSVNLLKVAGWPILKRVIPVVVVIAVIVALIVWLA
jgi:carbon monoxide dehydrogenase subunit G